MKKLILVLALVVAYGVSVSNASTKVLNIDKSEVTFVADTDDNTVSIEKAKKVKKAKKKATVKKAATSEKACCSGAAKKSCATEKKSCAGEKKEVDKK